MANYSLVFGDYEFPPTFYVADDPRNRVVPAAKLPKTHGARVLPGTKGAKRWTIEGMLKRDVWDATDLRDKLDALQAALQEGPTTFRTHDDRYWCNVQQDGDLSYSYEATWFNRIVRVRFDLITGDPHAYSDTEIIEATHAVEDTPATILVTAGGTAYALPELRLTVGGSGAVTLGATITNETTGEAFTLAGAVTGGDVLYVNSRDRTVLIGGVNQKALFDGLFPRLAVGENEFTVEYTSGTITNVGFVWRDRYL